MYIYILYIVNIVYMINDVIYIYGQGLAKTNSLTTPKLWKIETFSFFKHPEYGLWRFSPLKMKEKRWVPMV